MHSFLKIAPMMAAIVLVSFSGCGKSVSLEGGRFSVMEPPTTPLPPGNPGEEPPANCNPGSVAELDGYGIYVKEVAHLNEVSVGRRVAAGDSHMLLGRIGMDLSPNKSRADLQVSRSLNLIGTSTPNGQTTYGTRFDNVNSVALGGFVKRDFDIDHGFEKVVDFSRGCDSVLANATVTKSCGKDPNSCVLRIRGERNINVAEVTAEDLRNTRKIQVQIPGGATLVSNFSGRTANFVSVNVDMMKPTTGAYGRVFWNFPLAVEIHFQNTLFSGTIVAPDARVNVHNQCGPAAFWSLDINATQSSW